MEAYAAVFAGEGALDDGRFESFMSVNGAKFYGLPANTRRMTIRKQSWRVPESFEVVGSGEGGRDASAEVIVPYMAGKEMHYQVAAINI